MGKLSLLDAVKYGIDKDWSMLEFDVVNPSAFNFSINLFDTTTLANVPTQPSPTLPPSILTSIVSANVQKYDIEYCTANNSMYITIQTPTTPNSVDVFDCSSETFTTSISIPTRVYGIVYNSINNCMYVASLGIVYVISCNTNTIIATITPPPPPPFTSTRVQFGAFNSTSNTIYFSRGTRQVIVIDCNTNTSTTIINLSLITTNPQRVAYNPVNNFIYVANLNAATVSVIDCNTNTLFSTISMPIGSQPLALNYNSLTNTIYVANSNTNLFTVINCVTNTIITSFAIPFPLGLFFDVQYYPISNLMYITDIGNNLIVIFDCNANIFLPTILATGQASSLAFNPTNNTFIVNIFTTKFLNKISGISTPYITGTGAYTYNDFVKDILNNPVWVKEIVFYTQNSTNINQVLNVITKDANGNECQVPYIPSLSIGTSQFQSGIAKADFPNTELVLGVNQFISNYNTAPNSTTKIILIYKQIEKIKLLSDKKKMCDGLALCNPLQTVKDKDSIVPFEFINYVDLTKKNKIKR